MTVEATHYLSITSQDADALMVNAACLSLISPKTHHINFFSHISPSIPYEFILLNFEIFFSSSVWPLLFVVKRLCNNLKIFQLL